MPDIAVAIKQRFLVQEVLLESQGIDNIPIGMTVADEIEPTSTPVAYPMVQPMKSYVLPLVAIASTSQSIHIGLCTLKVQSDLANGAFLSRRRPIATSGKHAEVMLSFSRLS